MLRAPYRMSKACMEWQISTICASGTISRMTPFMVPTKWSLLPKSVVRVMIGRAKVLLAGEDEVLPECRK